MARTGEESAAIMIANKMKKHRSLIYMGNSKELLSNIKYVISTGCTVLDSAIGVLGLPSGKIIEIYGDESTGKSAIALLMAAMYQQAGGTVLWLDTEVTFSQDMAICYGVDLDNIQIMYPETIEQAAEFISSYIEAKAATDKELGEVIPSLVVWDSVAGTTSEDEEKAYDSDGLGKMQISSHARQYSKMFRLLTRPLAKNGVTALFINQTREKIGVMFGDNVATFGGKALKFYASVRIALSKVRPYKRKGEEVGVEIRFKVMKNKVGKPGRKGTFPIIWDEGIDDAVSCFWTLKESKIIRNSGAWHFITINDQEIKFQTKSWRQTVFTPYQEEVRQLVLSGASALVGDDDEEEDEM